MNNYTSPLSDATPGRPGSSPTATEVRSKARPLRLRSILCLSCALVLLAPGAAQADAVTDWNEIADTHAVMPLPLKLRVIAMTQIAVHDALNAIDPRYQRYTIVPPAHMNALPQAAVATAARDVLMSAAPEAQRPAIESKYQTYVLSLPGCPAQRACAEGISAGRSAAAAIIAARVGDKADGAAIPYTRAPGPGIYQPTPAPTWATLSTPAFEHWAAVTPFALRHRRQFRAPRSHVLNLRSFSYAIDYYEVKALGSARARRGDEARDNSEESRIARFWYGSGGEWAPNTRAILQGRDLDLWRNARLFALVAISQADVAISVFDSKYHYDFWRPVTAINWIHDGNPFTIPDTDWLPYLVSPPYPDYPCGIPMLAGAGTEVLRRYFRSDRIAYTVTGRFAAQNGLPADTITRSFGSLSQAADESASARVYAGIHFRSGCETGVELGEKIGGFVFRHTLRPLRRER